MSHFAVIDTSIYVGHYRHGLYQKEFNDLQYIVRNASVVIAELRRGCLTHEEEKIIEELANLSPLVTPTEKNWLESGRLLSFLAQDRGYLPNKLRDLHFDVLIALSAKNIGAVVITANPKDFQEIRRLKEFKLVVWD